ncbi:prolipoprotein diacylglyceryl transferase [Mycobacterium saskatchewanense]|uniref:prolipoprotein diacylglyceryl transferase n=1 Tax=Mycobacterium saskatchewanense TaxID=220927 RepID=UPI000A15D271|nr:prolipoprotein diacylglyceryl transferase [Mycobacterium saskatchewanense]BBX61217.1 prolipoprotein diacylglyceryl transferase [Mycobacterium saskatchewanense]
MTLAPTYFPSPPQGVWHLGPLPIRAYALFIITGIVVALIIGDRRWEARGGQRGVIYDVALWAVPFGLIGGRLYHLATDWRTYWGPGGAGFGAALRIWDGGLGIWGAVALGGVGAWIACRRRGIPLPAFGDAIAPGIVLAQAIGRLGNYFNQELYGRETTLPWGLEIFYRRDPSGYVDPHSLDGVSTGQVALVVQPTFLYELIWNVLVFAALIYLDRRFTLGHGRLFALYVAGYCIGRFGVELLRDDTATHIAGIRINSFTSTFVFIGAVVYFIVAPKGREDPESLRGNEGVVEVSPEPEPVVAADVPESPDADAAAAEPEEPEAGEPEAEVAPEAGEAESPTSADPEPGESAADAAGDGEAPRGRWSLRRNR